MRPGAPGHIVRKAATVDLEDMIDVALAAKHCPACLAEGSVEHVRFAILVGQGAQGDAGRFTRQVCGQLGEQGRGIGAGRDQRSDAERAAAEQGFKSGQIEVRPVQRRQVFVGGVPVGDPFE